MFLNYSKQPGCCFPMQRRNMITNSGTHIIIPVSFYKYSSVFDNPN